jgi:DNA-binding transcriptional ArsR family regulator
LTISEYSNILKIECFTKEGKVPMSGEESFSSLETQQLERAADILKTVAHPVRLQVIDILERGERTVSELSQYLGTQQPYTSQQLNLMKAKGILASRRNGNQVFYSVANPSVIKIIHCVRQQSTGSESGDGRLGASVSDSLPSGD